MKKKKFITSLVISTIIVLSYLGCLRPFLIKKNIVEGKVKNIHIGGINDLVIVLENDSKRYFINRGLEKGLSIKMFEKQLNSKPIRITTKHEWFNIFDLNDKLREIENIMIYDSIYYKDNF